MPKCHERKLDSNGFNCPHKVIYIRIVPYKPKPKNIIEPTLETYPNELPTLKSSWDLTKNELDGYQMLGSDQKIDDSEQVLLAELMYPCQVYETFPLIVPCKPDLYNPTKDLRDTVEAISSLFVDSDLANQKQGPTRQVIKFCNRKSPSELQEAIHYYNQVLQQELKHQNQKNSSFEFVCHVMEQAYSRQVAPFADSLVVKGFSNQVYGEVKQKLVDEFIKQVDLQPGQIFVDLGSGIGNVVLQVAAQCLCESFGIEIQENASKLANKQLEEFLGRMQAYQQPCGKITLKQGDFLEDPQTHEIIQRADVIFVNK